jgi:hypothetical protein
MKSQQLILRYVTVVLKQRYDNDFVPFSPNKRCHNYCECAR